MKRLLPLLLALMLLLSACTAATPEPTPAPTEEITAQPTEAPLVLQGDRSEEGALVDLSSRLNIDGFVTWRVFFTAEGMGVFQLNTAAGRYRVGLYNLYTGALDVRYEDTLQMGGEESDIRIGLECLSTDPLLLYDSLSQVYTLFDGSLKPVRIMPVSALGAYDQAYSVVKDCLYYITQHQELKVYNTSTGESSLLDIPVGSDYAYIEGLYSNDSIIAISYWNDNEQVCKYFNLDTLAEVNIPEAGNLKIWENGSDYAYINYEEKAARLYFGNAEGVRTGSWLQLEKEAERYNACVLFDQGLVITTLTDVSDVEDDFTMTYTLKLYSRTQGLQLNTLTISRVLEGEDYGLILDTGCYNEAAQLCCFVIPTLDAGGQVILWDLSVQGAVNNDLSLDNKIVSQAFGDLPDDVGAYAQKLTDYYGVNIYTGEEAARYFPDYAAEAVTDTDIIRQGLETLEEVLALYPVGFFSQLTYGDTKSVDIYLCGALTATNSYNLSDCDAFAVVFDNQQMVVLNIERTYGLRSTLCHEFAHSIDHKLDYVGGNTGIYSLDEAVWQGLNPSDFHYFYAYLNENGDSYSWQPIYDYTPSDPAATEDVNNIYFIDTYSMTFPTEDRARIMEYCMQEDIPYYFESSHLLTKLRYYSQAIRTVFDTTGWPEVTTWERALQG